MRNFKKMMLSEKVPWIVCAVACMASVLMGFALGFIVFGPVQQTVAYADTAAVHYLSEPYFAPINPENCMPPVAEYSQPAEYEPPASHLYVVTMLDGYIVVYYAEENGGGIKELTNTFAGALATEEQERLAMGIRIYTDEELARILQDYGS